MTSEWSQLETGRHQDHVIAHVLGTTVLGYFELDGAAYILLDIGFIWTIYVDGEMGLLTQSLAINELDVDRSAKAELLADVQLLHDGQNLEGLARMKPALAECLIKEVSFYADDNRRRILITGEEANLVVDTSLGTGKIRIEQL
ncbi:MAG TPA: hypothetical protein VGN95_20295 [Pyrinomonadaceae bacterium]|jgi:hypothetical protein|nr:hypothetical protein [Pyrinomonadaceae bacterium]